MKITEINQKRQHIARFTPVDLAEEPKSTLVKMASGIIRNAAKMKKPDLIKALLEATKAERTLAAIIPNTPLEVIELNNQTTEENAESNFELAEFCAKLWKDFRDVVMECYADGVWDEQKLYRSTTSFAGRVTTFLNTKEGKDGKPLHFTTKARYRSKISACLKAYADNEEGKPFYKQISGALDEMLRQVSIVMTDIMRDKNKADIVNRAVRKDNKTTIDFAYLYNFAKLILTSLDKLPASEWRKVSIALAIVTGRRMAEIHLDKTQFKLVSADEFQTNPELAAIASDHTHVVWFEGQLKAKGLAAAYYEQCPMYPIPVLIHSELVIKGRNWLVNNGKVVDTSEKADKRYSKDLSEAMKWLRGLMKIDHKNFTYKGLRSIYALVCHKLFNPDKNEMNQYIGLILGHGRREMMLYGTSKMVDYETPESYKADFEVVNAKSIFN